MDSMMFGAVIGSMIFAVGVLFGAAIAQINKKKEN